MEALKYLVLDVDNTLYPKSSGLDLAMKKRILLYLMDKHGLSAKEAEETRERYVKKYGMSLPGIMEDFDVDVVDYQEFIHDIDVKSFVKPNPKLADYLASLPLKKVIYTNSSHDHSVRILDALGVEVSLFSSIVDYRATGCISKPDPSSFKALLGIIGAKGNECVMVDDMPKTVCVAKNLFGMKAVLVDEDRIGGCDEADWIITSIGELTSIKLI